MSALLDLHLLASRAHAAGARLRRALWAIVQTSFAAGIAWYIAFTVLGHRQPFFAPVAAAVCMSASNVLRGQRALQMIGGVTLGIGAGVGIAALLGTGAVAIGVAVLIALTMAVIVAQGFVARGLMFFNQAAASAVLIVALPEGGPGSERLFDALIGGGLALLISIVLFPAAPLPLLHDATRAVYGVLRDTLEHLEGLTISVEQPEPGWTLEVSEHINQALAGLAQARSTAKEIVRVAPRRRPQRAVVAAEDLRATQLTLLASTVINLARTITTTAVLTPDEPLPAHLRDAIHALAEAIAGLAEHIGSATSDATAKAELARWLAEDTHTVTATTTSRALLVASIIGQCARDVSRLAGP
ncbi:MAG: FUSC family protein [Pseudonocardiaceae bacterium]